MPRMPRFCQVAAMERVGDRIRSMSAATVQSYLRSTVTRILIFATVLGTLVVSCAEAQRSADTATGSANGSVGRSTAATSPIRANNVVQLRQKLGQTVTVVGTVERASESQSGHNFLNFSASELSVVCLKPHVPKFTEGPPAKLFRNKDIVVTGKLEEYRGKLQIPVTDPSQIQLADSVDSDGSGSQFPRAKLQAVGRDAWQSPGGLRYRGRDPMGLSRIEHIMRHTRDIPDRVGSHGVFATRDQDEVFGLIDAAWQKAEKEKLRSVVEGDRSTLTVAMGYRVGYLGGENGKRRQNPPLTRIFIVFETGTKNIVTAFPK